MGDTFVSKIQNFEKKSDCTTKKIGSNSPVARVASCGFDSKTEMRFS